MKLTITSRAQKQTLRLPKTFQIIIAKKIRGLVKGTPRQTEKLAGYKNLYRERVGNYRIVYQKSPDEILVVLVAHRKEIYKILEQLLK